MRSLASFKMTLREGALKGISQVLFRGEQGGVSIKPT